MPNLIDAKNQGYAGERLKKCSEDAISGLPVGLIPSLMRYFFALLGLCLNPRKEGRILENDLAVDTEKLPCGKTKLFALHFKI
jgi:hypothetical protein